MFTIKKSEALMRARKKPSVQSQQKKPYSPFGDSIIAAEIPTKQKNHKE